MAAASGSKQIRRELLGIPAYKNTSIQTVNISFCFLLGLHVRGVSYRLTSNGLQNIENKYENSYFFLDSRVYCLKISILYTLSAASSINCFAGSSQMAGTVITQVTYFSKGKMVTCKFLFKNSLTKRSFRYRMEYVKTSIAGSSLFFISFRTVSRVRF